MYKDFNILIIEDEKKIAEMVKLYLERDAFQVTMAHDGLTGLKMAENEKIHLIILDLNLPVISGEEILRQVRSHSEVPILLLTAKNDETARVAGFVLGADDYISKPFSAKELVERVKAVLRRSYKEHFAGGTLIQYKNLVIDDRLKEVTHCGERIELTANEYKLLLTMASRPHQVFTREALAEFVFGYDYEAQERNIDTYVKNIRKKLKEDPKAPNYIKTRFGLGYQFGGDSDEA
jgi:DNA-binding response OmpR family regulator